MKRYGEHRFPGKLFVVEGIDGSGKSTQLKLLYQWLQGKASAQFLANGTPRPWFETSPGEARKSTR
jgi:dTMP kinase